MIYAATGSRARALLWSLGSGLAEPLGALLGLLLFPQLTADPAVLLALVAGLMSALALGTLLPAAKRAADARWVGLGLGLGALVPLAALGA